MDGNTIVSKNMNFKSVMQNSGKYRYLRLNADSGANGNSVTLDPASSSQVSFKLPSVVYNLSKSFISYTSNLPAVAALSNLTFTDVGLPWVQSIQFGTQGGLNLLDLQNSNLYTRAIRKIDTSLDEFESSDPLSGLTKSDLTSANFVASGYTALAGNSLGVTAGAPAIAAPSPNEPQYLRSSSAVNTAMQVQANFPLSGITSSIMSMPQDLYFGTDLMYLRLNTAPSSKMGYLATNGLVSPITGAVVFTAQPVISNLYLYLAVEQDVDLKAAIINQYNSGNFKFAMPFPYCWRQATVNAGNFTLSANLTSQYGKLLKRIVHVPMPAAETLNNAYDHSNFSGSKITSYQTFMDSQPLQDAVVNCVQASNAAPGGVLDDWRENQHVCKNTTIQDPASYQINWFHADTFAEKSSDPHVPDSQIYEGIDLTIPKQWSIQLTSTASLNHYTFASFVKMVKLEPGLGPIFI